MKKVLHYKTNFLNKTETFIERLVRNHQNFAPVALCYRPRSYTEGLPVFSSPSKGFARWVNISAFHLNLPLPYYYNTIKNIQPDIIHAHFGFDGVKLIRIARSLNIPLVVSFYGSDVSRLPSELGWTRRYRKLAQYGTRFIAASELMKETLIRLGFPEGKINIVRFGVDTNSAPFSEVFLSSPKIKIMMVGRMVEKKGFEYAIRAFHELHKQGIETELNLFGNGPLMKSLKKLTSSFQLESRVHFHGYQPVETILKTHNDHTILLAPSVTAADGDMEGLPNTILEAMAKGTPVVATKHAAIPEVIEDGITGFLVDERDVNGLADVIEKIIRGNFDLNEIRKNARKVIEDKYKIQWMVHDIEKVYDQILTEFECHH